MKKLVLLLMLPFVMEGQKIKENKKDDMTGNTVIRTSSERITGGMSPKWIKASVTKINTNYWLNLNSCFNGSFFIVQKGSDVILKLNNDSLIKLKATEMVLAEDGMGGKQATVTCLLSEADFSKLKSNSLTKIRITTTDGYGDFEIKDQEMVKKELLLVEKN